MANCDVFISYRREGGRDIARCLQLALTARGAKCFFDLHDSRKGKFPEKINSAIEGAKYFVLLLTDGNTLDRCTERKDWVRQEIAYALEKNVPIIPVVPSEHPKRFSNVPLPRAIAQISDIQMSELSLDGNFEHDVDLLMEERLEKIASQDGEKEDVQEREKVFLSAAQRYKSNDGKIDDVEMAQLDKLADELLIGKVRRRALVEQIEAQYGMTQDAAKVFLSAARRHKNDDGVIDDEERADLVELAKRLSLNEVKREELVQFVEQEYEALRKKSNVASDMGKDVTFNAARGEFEPAGDAASVPVETEPAKSRYTLISDVLTARFASLPGDPRLFLSDIPVKKRAKAWRSMNVREEEDSICLLCDDTVFGSASEGIVVTNEAVYFKNLMEHPVRLRLDKVNEVKLEKDDLLSIGGYGCECHMLEKRTKRALCKALDGLGVELAKLGVTFGEDTSAVDAVLGYFSELKGNDDVYVGDNIPEKKRMNAHRALHVKEPVTDLCVLADATVFGSAEEGLVVTPKAVYFKNSFESPNRISWEDVRSVEVRKKNLVVNGFEFSSIGADLAKAAPLLAKGIRSLVRKNRLASHKVDG